VSAPSATSIYSSRPSTARSRPRATRSESSRPAAGRPLAGWQAGQAGRLAGWQAGWAGRQAGRAGRQRDGGEFPRHVCKYVYLNTCTCVCVRVCVFFCVCASVPASVSLCVQVVGGVAQASPVRSYDTDKSGAMTAKGDAYLSFPGGASPLRKQRFFGDSGPFDCTGAPVLRMCLRMCRASLHILASSQVSPVTREQVTPVACRLITIAD